MNATLKDYSRQQLAAQPIGAWTGMAFRLVVGALREQLAVEGLTQPHWWILNHAAGSPGRWNREELTEGLVPWDDARTDFPRVFDDLVARGWLTEDDSTGRIAPTTEGEEGRARARERNL
ncbi:MarR family transcriptional regulator, partial [Streptomyces hydrogenans]|uniref:MarR family transcriptional regulator n=1 Tax=Streptomyces hydrogenans TaxID=1873719 RepID=UPI003627FE2B